MKNQKYKFRMGAGVLPVLPVLLVLLAALAAVGGCKSIEVNKRPQTALTYTDAEGAVHLVLDKANKPVILDGGWEVDYFQHWMWTRLDTLNASAGTGVTLSLNGYESGVDSNLVALVKTSFDGATQLAAKIAAAIATSGGSAAADGVAALVRKFVANGGDVSKATVSCANGACTVTDGTVSESCTDCFAQ